MSELTYGKLDQLLRSLGFSVRITKDPQAKVYEHDSGALIALPILSDEQSVLPRHLLVVRATLDAYGIADPTDTLSQLRTA